MRQRRPTLQLGAREATFERDRCVDDEAVLTNPSGDFVVGEPNLLSVQTYVTDVSAKRPARSAVVLSRQAASRRLGSCSSDA